MVIVVVPVGVLVAVLVLSWLLDSEAVQGCLGAIGLLIAVPALAFFAWVVVEIVIEGFVGEGRFPGPDEVLFGAHNYTGGLVETLALLAAHP